MESLECFTKESIALLHKHNLFRLLLRAEIIRNILDSVTLEEEVKNSVIEINLQTLGLTDPDKFKSWLKKSLITYEEYEFSVLKNAKLKVYYKSTFDHKVEAKFLERKSELDIVTYSLIRVKDPYLARELYLRILNRESDFGDLATQYAEGIEKHTRGIIGPVSLKQAHPTLAELLRISKVGIVNSPIRIDDSSLVVRLESYNPAQLNEVMREKMSEELFNNWIEEQIKDLLPNFIDSSKLDEGKML